MPQEHERPHWVFGKSRNFNNYRKANAANQLSTEGVGETLPRVLIPFVVVKAAGLVVDDRSALVRKRLRVE